MTKLQTNNICVYCGTELSKTNKTRDHVPPRSFFTKSERSQFTLITVPACSECNNGDSVQDETAKYISSLCTIQMRRETPEQMQSLKKTLKENNHLSQMVKSAKPTLMQDTMTRLYTFEKKISLDKTYIEDTEKVLCRIARGLYWHHFKKVLNAGKYKVCFHAGLDLFTSAKELWEVKHKRLKFILEAASYCKRVDLLPGVFSYWIGIDREGACCFFMLYRKALLVSIIALPD